ncbi:hypothetical protein ABZP36_020754 [Zizania latifolia]
MASPAGHGGGGDGVASGGKGSMDGDAAAGEGVTCGICLTDARLAIRGELDCCTHHFCFVCIMAWARVESRCPFCKARFRAIRRPPVPGCFPSERLVTVAERSQVCNPSGHVNSTVNTDPYANTSCSVCNCSSDDNLLLLCELCDSAAHTYCVGLGTVIPEDDWFCTDCMTAKEEHSRCQNDDDSSSDQGNFQITIEAPRADPVTVPSIFNTVDEDYSLSSVRRTSVRSGRHSISNPVPSIFDIVDGDYTTIPIGRLHARSTRLDRTAGRLPSQSTSAESQCPESSQERDNVQVLLHAHSHLKFEKARTLHNSRNLSNRIRELRENWPALRAGSVGFATQLFNSRRGNGTGTISITENQRSAKLVVNSRQNGAGTSDVEERLQSATTFTEEASTSSGHANKISPKDDHDVCKAWKMLEIAKSSGGKKKSNKPSSLNCIAPFSMGNRSTSYSPIDTILGGKNNRLYYEITQKNNVEHNYSAKMEYIPPTMNFGECRKLPENYRTSDHGRITSTIMRQESSNGNVASSSHSEDVDQTFESLCDASRPERSKSDKLRPLTSPLLSGQSMVTSSLRLIPTPRSQSTEMVNPQELSVIATSNDIGIAGSNALVKSSRPDHHESKRKLCSETHADQGSKRSRLNCKITKSDISSLAIRELKLLNIDKTYGSDTFKEVARAATHTVLASCGLEHSQSLALALSRPVCKHTDRIEPLQSPALTKFCRECLCNFVKEVIGSLLSERKMDQTASSC